MLKMLFPFPQDLDVLSGEGQQRIEGCCLDRTTVGSAAVKECLPALGTVSFSTSLPCLCSGDSMNSEVERGWNEEIFQLAVHSAKRKVLDHLPFMLGWCLVLQSESESESSSEGWNKEQKWKCELEIPPSCGSGCSGRVCFKGHSRAGNEHFWEMAALAELMGPEMVFEGVGRCCWGALLVSLHCCVLWDAEIPPGPRSSILLSSALGSPTSLGCRAEPSLHGHKHQHEDVTALLWVYVFVSPPPGELDLIYTLILHLCPLIVFWGQFSF